MASVFDVEAYVVKKSGPITTMKLQKLVYYCQAWSLAWDDIPLFEEEFQAWANGPVCQELFNLHRGLFVVNEDNFREYTDYKFSPQQIETMDAVLKYYGDKQPQWLSELTHRELPWRESRAGLPAGVSSHSIISKESMRQYYGGLK